MGKAGGQDDWNIQIRVNPTQVRDLLNHPGPVLFLFFLPLDYAALMTPPPPSVDNGGALAASSAGAAATGRFYFRKKTLRHGCQMAIDRF